ncbi:MAG: hypothetical protein WAU36_02355 [Cyclobacteriaceae bacterium]
MEPKYLDLVDNLKQWVAILDRYELNIAVSREFDNFWYKQKLAEIVLLREMKNRRSVDYLQAEYSEINHKLRVDKQKLDLLSTSSAHRFQFS